jgi:fructose-1,6-bisphosphatase/inositol monophosphatase family enzyme
LSSDASHSSFDLELLGGRRGLADLIAEVVACGRDALGRQRAFVATATAKSDGSPVTDADRAIEERLRAFCESRYPGCAIVGEESPATEPANGSELRVVIDPIDGTRAFMRGLATWSVLLGIEHAGRAVVGVAFMPVVDEVFTGVDGQGSTVNGRPIELSRVDRLSAAAVGHGALSQFASAARLDLLPELARHTYTQRGFGDFENYRLLLKGNLDAVVDPGIAPWDVCAPAVLVRAAGGRLTDFRGHDDIRSGSVIASNGLVHDELVTLVSPRGQ